MDPQGQPDSWDPEKYSQGNRINSGLWLKEIVVVLSITFQENTHDLPVAMKEGCEMKELFSVAATWSSPNMKEGGSS